MAWQSTLEAQAKVGETGGLTFKASASAGFGPGVTASVSASTNLKTVGATGAVGGALKTNGGIVGIRPPSVAVGYTWKMTTGSHIKTRDTDPE